MSFRLSPAWLAAPVLWVVTQAHALPLTLDTRWLDANAKLTLSAPALQALQLTGISVQAGGQAAQLGNGLFNLPISQLTADVGLFSLTPVAGKVDGSVLNFHSATSGRDLQIDQLQIDFASQAIWATLTSDGSSTRTTLFDFSVTTPLKWDLSAGISLTESLGNLHMGADAASAFADRIGLPSYLAPALTGIDFGSVQAVIRPWFRTQVSSVPELPTGATMVMGLLAFGLARLRARRVGEITR